MDLNFNDYYNDVIFEEEEYDEDTSEIMPKITLSEEQQIIIDNILAGKNVIVDAVAGSGKTTLVLGMAAQTSKSILQITYNAALRLEVREKANKLGLPLAVHSYHSLAVNFYDRAAYTDVAMNDIIECNKKIKKAPMFDIIVIDEAQDMKFMYYQLIKKFIFDNGGGYGTIHPITLLIMGDYYQAIYVFSGADPRYLTFGENIWGVPFINLSLSTSYRLTNETAEFVTHITGKKINTIKNGKPVTYIHGNGIPDKIGSKIANKDEIKNYHDLFWSAKNPGNFINRHIFDIIATRISEKFAQPEDIFILVPSVRQINHASRELEHLLVDAGYPCYVSGDEGRVSDDILRGKIVFTTLNQSKGRERKLVFVYNFDSSYFKYYGQDIKNHEICPNIHYVAMTRSSSELYICHQVPNYIISFMPELKFLDHIGDIPSVKKYEGGERVTKTSPTDIVRFIKDKYAIRLNNLLEYDLYPGTCNINIPQIEKFENTHEETSDLIGIAIPAAWEYKMYKTCSICKRINKKLSKDILEIIKIANEYHAFRNNVKYKVAQIDNYKWFTHEILDPCMDNYDKFVGEIEKFEVDVSLNVIWHHRGEHHKGEQYLFEMNGCIDGIFENTVWEFKCVSEIQMEHLLQLAIYAFMWEQLQKGTEKMYDRTNGGYVIKVDFDSIKIEEPLCKYKLFNCRTGEIRELHYKNILEIMNILFENKVFPYTLTDDKVFIEMCNNYVPTPQSMYDNMNVDELKDMCREMGVKGYSGKKRADIVELIKEFKRLQFVEQTTVEVQPTDIKTTCETLSVISATNVADITDNVSQINVLTETVAKPVEDLSTYKISQLQQLCKDRGIKKYSKLNKAELIDLIMLNV